jgi:hypothetical protein
VHYFNGQLLSVADLQAEQDYHRDAQRRHYLLFHGAGVVSGLKVSLSKDGSRSLVTVVPGHAVDPRGNVVSLCDPFQVALPAPKAALLVKIRYTESLADPVPAMGSDTGDETQFTRVQEGAEVLLVAVTDATATAKTSRSRAAMSEESVVLARLLPSRSGWRLDRTFKVCRSS